jgi:hypothetical protein
MRGKTNTLEDIYMILDKIEPDEYGCLHYPSNTPIGYYREVRINWNRFRAHCIALERKLGRPIQPGFQALHTCDCKSCVNQEHLYEGTYGDNVLDRWARDPEFRQAISQVRKITWQDPKYRQKRLDTFYKNKRDRASA